MPNAGNGGNAGNMRDGVPPPRRSYIPPPNLAISVASRPLTPAQRLTPPVTHPSALDSAPRNAAPARKRLTARQRTAQIAGALLAAPLLHLPEMADTAIISRMACIAAAQRAWLPLLAG